MDRRCLYISSLKKWCTFQCPKAMLKQVNIQFCWPVLGKKIIKIIFFKLDIFQFRAVAPKSGLDWPAAHWPAMRESWLSIASKFQLRCGLSWPKSEHAPRNAYNLWSMPSLWLDLHARLGLRVVVYSGPKGCRPGPMCVGPIKPKVFCKVCCQAGPTVCGNLFFNIELKD